MLSFSFIHSAKGKQPFLSKKKCNRFAFIKKKQICMEAMLNIEVWHVHIVVYVYCLCLHLKLCRNFKSTVQHDLLFDEAED